MLILVVGTDSENAKKISSDCSVLNEDYTNTDFILDFINNKVCISTQ